MTNWEKTKLLLIDEDPILIYARRGDVDGIRKSLNILNVDKKDEKGYSPLMLAAMNGHVEAVRFLLSVPADINSLDNHGNSVLMGATFTGQTAIVEILLDHGADPNVCNLKKQTALLFARTFKLTKIEKVLLQHQ